jgi:hypothetical protein
MVQGRSYPGNIIDVCWFFWVGSINHGKWIDCKSSKVEVGRTKTALWQKA